MAKGCLGAEAQEGPSGTHQGSKAGRDVWKAGTRTHKAPLRESVAWATLPWGAAPTSPSQESGHAEMVFPHLEMHNFIHSEPSFHCTEMDVATHVILTSRLSHPYIKQPRELELIHLFATEDGSVSKLFY